MRRTGIHIGTTVDQQGNTCCCWNQWSQGSAFHAFAFSYQDLSAYQYSSCTATGYKSRSFFTSYHSQCLYQRGVFLFLNSVYRRFSGFNDLRCMNNFQTFFRIRIFIQFFFQNILLTYQIYIQFRLLPQCFDHSFYRFLWRIIATHSVHGHFNIFAHISSSFPINLSYLCSFFSWNK